jgi:hypothetical protein
MRLKMPASASSSAGPEQRANSAIIPQYLDIDILLAINCEDSLTQLLRDGKFISAPKTRR